MEVKQTIKERYRLLALEYEANGVYARTYAIIYSALHNDLGLLRPLETLRLAYLAIWRDERQATDLLSISYYNTARRLIAQAIDELHWYMYVSQED